MTTSEIFRPSHRRATTSIDRLPGRGGIIVGYTGSPVSVRALDAVLRTAEADARIALICAVRPFRPPRSTTAMHDALKSEAYLLSDRASTDELIRRGVEAVHAHSIEPATAIAVVGDPVTVISRAASQFEAAHVVVGMRDDRPTSQVRRIAKALPDHVGMFATNGDTHISLVRSRRARRVVRTLAPQTIGRAVGA
ncbi:universal stress protein [Gordonia sp. SID5947]|uniref:universal stress protein n=1 Tax=Gordonia sp. SID5947 TaxID=2690315 RepID=UPI00136B4F6E|nr:universal stress protein [Gordonia sp. SID5947]MYR05562.1 universal stress protein [Gordonia sp. SID5947]